MNERLYTDEDLERAIDARDAQAIGLDAGEAANILDACLPAILERHLTAAHNETERYLAVAHNEIDGMTMARDAWRRGCEDAEAERDELAERLTAAEKAIRLVRETHGTVDPLFKGKCELCEAIEVYDALSPAPAAPALCPCGEPIGGPPCTFEHPCPYGKGMSADRWPGPAAPEGAQT